MGGVEGAKGYLYQCIVALDEVLAKVDSGFDKMYMEYESKNDKVDVAFQYEDKSFEVIQVKSSKNNFTTYNVNEWLTELINDSVQAETYRLILVGTCSDTTKREINSIRTLSLAQTDSNTQKLNDKLSIDVKENISKIQIDIMFDNIDKIESSLAYKISKVLYNNGINGLNPSIFEQMVQAMSYTFNKFCTNSGYISKDDFIFRLVEWAKYNYNLNEDIIKHNNFNVVLDKIYKPFDEIIEDKEKKIQSSKDNIIKLYNEILEESKNTKIEFYGSQFVERAFNPTNFMECAYKQVEIETDKIEIIKIFFDKLEIDIEKNFFDIEGLKENTLANLTAGMFGTRRNREFKGSEFLKKKYKTILKIYNDILYISNELDIIKYISETLKSYNVSCIYIENLNNRIISSTLCKIKIPKDINIFSYSKCKIPNSNIIDKFFEIIETYIKPKESSSIKTKCSGEVFIRNDISIPIYKEPINDEFKRKFFNIMDYKIFTEEDFLILEFFIKDLRPLEKTYIPSFLIHKSHGDIQFEFNTENNPNEKIEIEL